MKKNNIKISVVIISYAQEKYISEAIESVLAQKVNFKYEVLLADDCSPDNTKKIIKKYEKKYPDIIKVLDRPKNLGAAANTMDACLTAKGEYITILEGDDYWCDENKLQFQVDFLDKNPDFYGVSHLQEGRDLDNNFKGYFPKSIREDTIIEDVSDYVNNHKIFSSSATVYRNFFADKKLLKQYEKLNELDTLIGDAQKCIFLCYLGKVFVSTKAMQVYRMRNNDGNSNFNSSHSIDEIQYRYLNIYTNIEKIFKEKYSFYPLIRDKYTLGVAYCICKRKFSELKKFNDLCPKKYKLKIILLFPFTSFKIIFNRFIRK